MSAIAELQAGRAGAAFTAELQRTIRAVAVARNFPPPDGHPAWDADAVWSTASEFMADAQTPRRLADLAVHSASADALRARLQGTVRNFLADIGRRTPIGKLVVRVNDVLRGEDGFRWVGGRWTRAADARAADDDGSGDVAGVDDPVALARAIAGMTVVAPAWGHDAHRAAPVADRATIVSLCDALLVSAGGSLTPRALARAIGHRLGVGQAPLSLEVAALDAGGATGAAVLADSTADEALRLRRAAEVVDELNDRERLSLAYPELTIRQLAPVLGASPSQAHTVRARAAQVVRAELLDDDDAEGVALLVMELSRNWADAVDNLAGSAVVLAMSVFGPAHPLDVDLADDALSPTPSPDVVAHLLGCFICRLRRDRLRHAPPADLHLGRELVGVEFGVPVAPGGPGVPSVDEVWRAGTDRRLLVLVLRPSDEGRVLVAPVTFDVEAADDETLVVEPTDLGLAVAVHPRLATEVPASALIERMIARLDVAGARRGPPVVDPSDPRLEVRQLLADRIGALDEPPPPDPSTGAGAPPPRPEQVRSTLIGDLRAFRGRMCVVRPLDGWGDVLPAHQAGWEPIATVDEVGVVLVVFDTPHGLADDADFDAARSVLTRFNATALVVLATAVSDTAEAFDSSSLNYGIDAPSGRHTAPRPLISGLAPFDAIAKFLDQSSGTRMTAPPSRGAVTRVDVDDILREAAGAATADLVRQGSKFRILPKRRGYESIADAQDGLAAALARAFGPEPTIVHDLLAL